MPILEVGEPGAQDYVALIESEVVSRYVARRWAGRGPALVPADPAEEAAMNLFVTVFMEQLSGLSCLGSPGAVKRPERFPQ